MPFNADKDSLTYALDQLSDDDLAIISSRFRMSEINSWIQEMLETIAIEAKNRIQSKIAILLNHGYGTGALFNSIYYQISDNEIVLTSTKNYFAILNSGFSPFNTAEALKSHGYSYATMRLPGGRVIHRKLPMGYSRPRKFSTAPANWIHPGFRGVDIYNVVSAEMESFVKELVTERVNSLKREASDGSLLALYNVNELGRSQYNYREQGKFAKAPDNARERAQAALMEQRARMNDQSFFNYTTNPNGSVSFEQKQEMEEEWEENIQGWDQRLNRLLYFED